MPIILTEKLGSLCVSDTGFCSQFTCLGPEAILSLQSSEFSDDHHIQKLKAEASDHGYTLTLLPSIQCSDSLGIVGDPCLPFSRATSFCSSTTTTTTTTEHMACSTLLPVALARLNPVSESFLEVRIAVVGNVDAGKSTLLGVLTKNHLDDGRGKARTCLFRHKHEIESGRTSSVGNEILGFDAEGHRISTFDPRGKKRSWEDVCALSSKILSFMDLAGHEKYLKTTMFGLTGYCPDYAMLIIGSNAGLIGMAKEHLALTLALKVPVILVFTKIDMTPENVTADHLRHICKLLKSPSCQRTPLVIRNTTELVSLVKSFGSGEGRLVPIFLVSSVTSVGLPLLLQFLNLIPIHCSPATNTNKEASVPISSINSTTSVVEYHITETYSVPGVGTVVSGTLLNGVITPGLSLYLGPDANGSFLSTQVKSIQHKRLDVDTASSGQSVTLALRKVKRSAIQKGMVILSSLPLGSTLLGSNSSNNGSMCSTFSQTKSTICNSGLMKPTSLDVAVCREFAAEILILFHSTTMTLRYQAMLHCGVIRQTVAIVAIEGFLSRKEDNFGTFTAYSTVKGKSSSTTTQNILRTGDRAIVRFRFLKHPEYLKMGARLFFREGRTKGIGRVSQLYID